MAADGNNEWCRIINLRGQWAFSIGDNPNWKKYDFDDGNWESIFAPSAWEEEGNPGYDGYAWYRLHFDFDMRNKDEYLVLLLGKIDDIDEAYLNGRLIGKTGHMYRNTEDIRVDREWSKLRAYRIQKNDLHQEGNLIAIRVYDAKLDGGIYEGHIGLMSLKNYRASRWQTNGKKTFFWDWFHN